MPTTNCSSFIHCLLTKEQININLLVESDVKCHYEFDKQEFLLRSILIEVCEDIFVGNQIEELILREKSFLSFQRRDDDNSVLKRNSFDEL